MCRRIRLVYNSQESEREETMSQRKAMSVAIVTALVLFLGAPHSFAIPVEGIVDPGSNWTTTLAGTATYSFTNLMGGSNSPFVGLSLTFDGNVFNLGATGVNNSSVSSGWSFLGSPTLTIPGMSTYEFALLGGAPIAAGSSLSFTANYSLLGNSLSNPWQQAFTVAYLGSPWLGGGSTTLTPEPGSLILLGSGLASLGLWRRKHEAKA